MLIGRVLSPDFIFITLSSHDTLKIANITHSRALLDYLRTTLIPYWPQRIMSEAEDHDSGEWQIKLGGDVWSAGGTYGIMCQVTEQETLGWIGWCFRVANVRVDGGNKICQTQTVQILHQQEQWVWTLYSGLMD
jgi:hypothetical protein